MYLLSSYIFINEIHCIVFNYHIWLLYLIFIIVTHEIFHYISYSIAIVWYSLLSSHLFVRDIFFILVFDYHSLGLLTLTELIAKFSTADSIFVFNTLKNILKQLRSQVSSAVWNHCCATQNDENSKFKYCIYYMIFKIYFTNISFNMWKHFQTQHNVDIDIAVSQVQAATLQQLEQLYLQAKSFDQIKAINAQVFQKQLDQNIINEALISLIIVQNLFFQIIE